MMGRVRCREVLGRSGEKGDVAVGLFFFSADGGYGH
jgi:hypothetical protein